MRIVVMVDGTKIEVSGKTQKIETLIAENPLYEKLVRQELKKPPMMAGTFRPAPDTGLGFFAILEEWEDTTKRKIEVVCCEDVDKVPSVEGVVY